MTHYLSPSLSVFDRLLGAAAMGNANEVAKYMHECSLQQRNSALIRAAIGGHLACLEILIPVAEPNNHHCEALRLAAREGHAECVKVLIPVSDPLMDNSAALSSAAMEGRFECVKQLIPVSDPKANHSEALQWACVNNDQRCFDALYEWSDPEAALACLKSEPSRPISTLCLLEDRLNAQRQKIFLGEIVRSQPKMGLGRKI